MSERSIVARSHDFDCGTWAQAPPPSGRMWVLRLQAGDPQDPGKIAERPLKWWRAAEPGRKDEQHLVLEAADLIFQPWCYSVGMTSPGRPSKPELGRRSG